MPGRRYSPAYLRYFKARLWNLAQPGFWGTAIFLSVVGLVIKEYWTHPDLFNFGQNNQLVAKKPANSSLSPEDQAIAADIDNLPVLFYDFDRGSLPSKASNSKNTQANNSKALLDDISKQQTAATEAYLNSLKQVNSVPISKLENPFVVQAENLLQLKDFQSESKFLGVNGLTPSSAQIVTTQTSANVGMGLTNQINSRQSTAVVSPLQTSLNQSTNQNLPTENVTTSTQINPFGRSPSYPGLNGGAIAPVTNGIDYTQPTVTNLLQNSTSIPNQNLAPRAANIPNQFPNISTNLSDTQAIPSIQSATSAVTPITPAAPNYIQTPTQGAITPSNPEVNSHSGNSSGLQQYNSSSPYQFPGPYTGGKQINGISYP